jgi:D-tyrosyl-tRNA(Tyr) deacylase
MRAVVQRVSCASVSVAGEVIGKIDRGLLVYAAAAPDDTDADLAYIADKVTHIRVFEDADGKMNLAVGQAGGAVLLVSAFTAQADARKGRRPSFDSAAPGPIAQPLIEKLTSAIRDLGISTQTGRFAAEMRVESINDGPICVLLESRRLF